MTRAGFITRTPAAAMLAAAAASGLVLAGCGNSSTATTASTSSSASGQPAASGSASAAGTSSSGSSGSVSMGSGTVAFFPLSVGNKWVYVDKLSGEQGTVTDQVISVTPVASGSKVVMKNRDDVGGGAPDTTTSALIVHSDGSITVPMTTAGDSFKLKSGGVLWPSAAQLASGQPHHDTLVMTMTMAGQTTTMRSHVVVKGDGTQTVHVPAGTYQATVIDELMTEKFSGVAIKMDIRTWVVNGVGPVKSEMTSNAGGREAIMNDELLKSFTKG
jgi:uncharacterized protein DUF3108